MSTGNNRAGQGRHDDRPWLSVRTQTRLLMAAFLVCLVVSGLVAFMIGGLSWSQMLQTVRNFLQGAPDAEVHLRMPLMAVVSVWAVLFLLLAGGGCWLLIWAVSKRRSRHVGKGMASHKQVRAAMGEDRVREVAHRAFPSKAAKEIAGAPIETLGIWIGCEQRTGQRIVLSYEDFIGIYGPSGAGKSTGLMVPAALEAPGALVMTSNEVSILDQVVAARSKMGRVWVFDLLNRTHYPHDMVWDPVAGCQRGEKAIARGESFVAGCAADDSSATNSSFFKKNAGMALRSLFHASALDGRDITDVLRWSVELTKGALVPRRILEDSEDPRTERMWPQLLESVATGAEQTVASTRTTLTQVVEPLMLQAITRWVVPRPGVPVFDPAQFVRSTDTLIIISDDTAATNVGPLCTMLFQEVIDELKRYAPITPHGKLEVPFTIVGDEIANIAPIDKLPELCAELRKLNVHIVLAFQSDSQPIARWGQHRGSILQEQMAAEIALPGLKSVDALKRFSELAGTTDVVERSISVNADGEYTGSSGSVSERAVMRTHEVRTMDDGEALLLWRNMPATKMRLQPWYQRSYADQVAAAQEASRDARRKRWQESVDRELDLDSQLDQAAKARRDDEDQEQAS